MSYERENIRTMHPYVPGEQPDELGVVKLNTNENPYPPCHAVVAAIRAVPPELLRRYPPPWATGFRRAAAQTHGLAPEQVLATNGGDELLRMAVTVFCDPQPASGQVSGGSGVAGVAGVSGGKAAIGGLGMAEPSYSLYPVLAEIEDTPVHRVALNENWAVPPNFAQQLNAAGCRLAILVNPHAPSGHLESVETLEGIARAFHGVLMIDEAYVDFAEHDALALLEPKRCLKNVLLLRTLSKGYSLAGLRFGYALGPAELIATLGKVKDSYNTDILSQTAATAALENRSLSARTWMMVIEERERVTAELGRLGYRVHPSESNFILATPPDGGPGARQLYESLKARRIFVRYFDEDRLRDKLRITIGTREQNDLLLAALGK